MTHGTYTAYSHHGCRCQQCRAANAAYKRAWKARPIIDQAALPHGTLNAYENYDCRCQPCRQAKSEANRRRPSRAKTPQANAGRSLTVKAGVR